jgi:hypothetical protein
MPNPKGFQTITLFMGGHGYNPITHPGRPITRSSNPHEYVGLTVNFLSFAGLANIQTESGLVFERKTKAKQEELIQKIKQSGHDTKYKLFTSEPAIKLDGLGTDYVTLSYIVPRIFKGRLITTQLLSKAALKDMRSEMLAVGMLAALEYSNTSPPVIETNPTFEKMWWFDDNPGHDRRRFDTTARTGPSRAAGNTKDNPILATNGLFILHTTNDEHSPFSISNIHEIEFTTKEGLPLISSNAIKRRNLLRKINYTSYWKIWIEAFDFSDVRDEDVLEIGSIEEAVFIEKQIYYAFQSENATDNPDDRYEVAATIDEEDAELEPPVTIEHTTQPPLISQDIIKRLKDILTAHEAHAHAAIDLNISIQEANKEVQITRGIFLSAVAAADELEALIEQKEKEEEEPMKLRSRTQEIARLKEQLSAADIALDGLREELSEQTNIVAGLESQLEPIKGKIISDVTKFIHYLISQPEHEVKTAIKNIIMRNKLKNILKFGIFHKRLSLSQIILFFRSLGYDIINIVDPSCFVLKVPRPIQTDVSTQEIVYSQEGIDVVEPHPHHWSDQLNEVVKQFEGDEHPKPFDGDGPTPKRTAVKGEGGTKRKKPKYSRKRRTRRKRCATRRRRNRRS